MRPNRTQMGANFLSILVAVILMVECDLRATKISSSDAKLTSYKARPIFEGLSKLEGK